MNFSFLYSGKPESQGSIRAFMPKGWKRPILTSTNKNLKKWRSGLGEKAAEAISEVADIDFPLHSKIAVKVSVLFAFIPPKSNKGKYTYKTTRPDLDKLIRSTLDAMTGIVYEDDSQVVKVEASKVFRTEAYVHVWVETL